MKTKTLIIALVAILVLGVGGLFVYNYFVEQKDPATIVNESRKNIDKYTTQVTDVAKRLNAEKFKEGVNYTKQQVDDKINKLEEIHKQIEAKAKEITNSALPSQIKDRFSNGINQLIEFLNTQLKQFNRLLPTLG